MYKLSKVRSVDSTHLSSIEEAPSTESSEAKSARGQLNKSYQPSEYLPNTCMMNSGNAEQGKVGIRREATYKPRRHVYSKCSRATWSPTRTQTRICDNNVKQMQKSPAQIPAQLQRINHSKQCTKFSGKEDRVVAAARHSSKCHFSLTLLELPRFPTRTQPRTCDNSSKSTTWPCTESLAQTQRLIWVTQKTIGGRRQGAGMTGTCPICHCLQHRCRI